jgi:hypothetical protein
MSDSSDETYYVVSTSGLGQAPASLFKKWYPRSLRLSIETYRDPTDHCILRANPPAISSSHLSPLPTRSILAEAKKIDKKGDPDPTRRVLWWESRPIVVTKGNDLGMVGARNLIPWANHRAEMEAEVINQTGSILLDHVRFFSFNDTIYVYMPTANLNIFLTFDIS